jgi:hypothetical protein
VAVTLAGLIALVVTAGLFGYGFYREAQRTRIAHEANAAATKAIESEVRGKIWALHQSLKKIRNTTEPANKLAGTVVMEGLLLDWALTTGPSRPGQPDPYQRRISQARQVLAAAADQPPSFNALCWESSLCFWLVMANELEEAAPRLASNRTKWAAHLSSQDPWLAQLSALEACTVIKKEINRHRAGEAPDRTAIRRAEADLRLSELFPQGGSSRGSGLHRLCLQTLIDLYGSPVAESTELHSLYTAELSAFKAP